MSDFKQMKKIAEAHGFTVERNRRDHWTFRDPDGRKVATASGSPSDARAHKNTAAHLRAASA